MLRQTKPKPFGRDSSLVTMTNLTGRRKGNVVADRAERKKTTEAPDRNPSVVPVLPGKAKAGPAAPNPKDAAEEKNLRIPNIMPRDSRGIGAFQDKEVAKTLSLPADQTPLYLIPVGTPK